MGRGDGFLMGIIFLVSVFVILMSAYAPYTIRPLYPFSTTTMYAYMDKEPIKRKVIFIVDRDDRERRLSPSEIWPLTYDKLFSKLQSLERNKKDGKKKMKIILRKLKNLSLFFIKDITVWSLLRKYLCKIAFGRNQKITYPDVINRIIVNLLWRRSFECT